jgi:glucose-1-phosphate adenylyltransferase
MARGADSRPSVRPDDLKKVLVIVLAGGRGRRLDPLTRHMSKPAIPFGGTFRIIDFTLANCVNSGLRRIYLLTQYQSAPLMRHIRHGWDIFSPELGEYIYTIPPQLAEATFGYQGTADAIYQNIYTLEGEHPDHVLVLSGDHIYRMDYRELLAQHIANRADATLAVTNMPATEAHHYGVIEVSGDGRITAFREKPDDIPANAPPPIVNMGIFLFRTEVLVEAAARDARHETSRHDFAYNLVPDLVARGACVMSYPFSRSAGEKPDPYWRDIGTLDGYYEANVDLVSVSPLFNLYDQIWPIRSAPIQAPPAKFVFSGGDSGRIGQAIDSLVSHGVIVSGGQVWRSIIGPNSRINSWARVEDSIILDGVEIERHAVVKKAIVDRDVVVPSGAKIGVDRAADEKRFALTPKGVVVVTADSLTKAFPGAH